MGENGCVSKLEDVPNVQVLLTAAEVAGELQVGEDALYSIVRRGELKAYRVARRLRFKRVDLEAYIERCLVKPGARLVEEQRAARHPGRSRKAGS